MAEENQDQVLQQQMAELSRSMQGLGTSTSKADNGLTKFAKGALSASQQLGSLGSSLAKGEGNFASLGATITTVTGAIGKLASAIPLVGGAAKALAEGVGDAAKFVLDQLDIMSKNYGALGDAGATAADGITGLKRQFDNMGFMTLPAFTKAINQNTVGMVAFGGTAAEGAEEFAKLAGGLTRGNLGPRFLRLGMSFDQVGESAAQYVSNTSRYGKLQTGGQAELISSTQKYIEEMDLLSRMTGTTRKEQEQEQLKSLSDVRFRAKLMEMEANGQSKEAEQMRQTAAALKGPMADAFRASATGVTLTDQAAEANMLTGDTIRQAGVNIRNGSTAITEVGKIMKGASEGTKRFSANMIYAGDSMGGVAIQAMDMAAIQKKADARAAKDGISIEEAVRKEQELLLNASDKSTKEFTDAQAAVAGANKNVQELGFTLAKKALPAVDAFATGLEKVTGFINKKFGDGSVDGKPKERSKDWQNELKGQPAGGGGGGGGGSSRSSEGNKGGAGGAGGGGVGGGGAKPSAPSGSNKEYYDKMYNKLLEEARKQGVENPEAIAKLGAAQTSLETGYGKHMVGNNAFGIKARAGGPGVGASTQEFENGKMVTKNQNFRKYDSPEDSAADFVAFLKENKRYKGVLGAKTGEDAIAAQGKTGYATDPEYFKKLVNINERMGGATSPAGPVDRFNPTLAGTDPNKTLATAQPAGAAAGANGGADTTAQLTGAMLNISNQLDQLNRTQQTQLGVAQKQLQRTS